MPYVQTNDTRFGEEVSLFYQDLQPQTATESAEHSQTVVLIHGWPLSHQMWEPQLLELPKHGVRVVAYDRRGFGKSSQPWGGYDYDTLADDLKALLDELDLQNVTLVGFSMGAGEVVRYFSRHGGARVSRAVLVAGITPYMLKTDSNPDGVPQDQFDMMREKLLEDRASFLATFSKQFYGVGLISKPVSAEKLEWDRTLAMYASPKATLDCMDAFSQTDFRDEMSAVNVPTLIIHGEADKTVPIDPTGEQAAQMIPDATYKIYDGAPHGLFFTDKDQLNADLLDFIQVSAMSRVNTGSPTY